jgi:alcohol dehydrogenase class IV
MKKSFSHIHMPTFICGRGSISFVRTLNKERVAVVGYSDVVKEIATDLFEGTQTEVRYIATIDREPFISDLFDNLDAVHEFQPDLILAIGGGSVMDVAKGLCLFYEYPDMSFEDSLKPFQLPELGKKAVSVFVPTTSGTGSETSSAAVFIDPETRVKSLLLSNTLIPRYAVIDPDFTDSLPTHVLVQSALDALGHAIESTTAMNANMYSRAVATQAALDILESLPVAVGSNVSDSLRKQARDKVHMSASLAGVAITNSFTGIVHSYDHPGPEFDLPHGIVCGIMLPYSMKLVGPNENYSCIARRLGYSGTDEELLEQLVRHIQEFNSKLGLYNTFKEAGVDEAAYLANIPRWSEISLQGMATKLSPANMDLAKSELFFELCYYGWDGK